MKTRTFQFSYPGLQGKMLLLDLLINFSLLACTRGFYVPGVAPVEFKNGDTIEVKAVKMTSTRTQLPYDYYSLPLCIPKNGTIYKSENLGISIWRSFSRMRFF